MVCNLFASFVVIELVDSGWDKILKIKYDCIVLGEGLDWLKPYAISLNPYWKCIQIHTHMPMHESIHAQNSRVFAYSHHSSLYECAVIERDWWFSRNSFDGLSNDYNNNSNEFQHQIDRCIKFLIELNTTAVHNTCLMCVRVCKHVKKSTLSISLFHFGWLFLHAL